MISKRIVPFFLLKGSRLVKGTNFKDFIDVGDPVSQGMIYDSQGADEIIIVDIEASIHKRMIDGSVINDMVTKCRLPICAGGGIKTVKDAEKYFNAGADKIAINTGAVLRPKLIRELADEFGSQSVVVSLDVKKNSDNDYDIYIFSGSKKAEIGLWDMIKKSIDFGAGELLLQSIDKEGTVKGLDLELYKKARPLSSVPLIASGGVSCYDDIVRLFNESDCDACAIGKMLFLRDYDIVRIKAYLKGKKVLVREA